MNLCINQETRPLGRRSPAKLIMCIAAPLLLSAAVVFRGELAQLVSGTQQNNLVTNADLQEANKSLREPVQLQAIDPTSRKLDYFDVSSEDADEEADESPAVAAQLNQVHKLLHSDVSIDSTDEEAEEECPDMFFAGTSYEEGDVVEMNGVVYKCKSWPSAQWCSVTSYEPGSEKSEDAWEVIGHCHEEIDPVPSEVAAMERMLLEVCPPAYVPSTPYAAGDKVSVLSGASYVIYECTAPNDGLCSTETPGSSLGWVAGGYCENTNSPTKAPTVSVCPAAYVPSTPYAAGDKVSVLSGASFIVYQCTPPNDGLCSTQAPGNSLGWVAVGYCENTASPTKAPATGSPTKNPATIPTTASPTKNPVTSPTTASPTKNPVATPTTASPTNAPITTPTTASPTNAPITTPTTTSPTKNPVATPTTTSPTKNPVTTPTTASPTNAPITTTPKSTIQIDSTLSWNLTCTGLDDAQILALAQTVERSTHITIDPLLPSDYNLQLTYVYQVCGQAVVNHTGYPISRRLQSVNDIQLYSVVSKDNCLDCGEEIFNTTNAELEKVVSDGTLATTIQDESGDQIKATFDPVVNSTFVAATDRPTGAPTLAPATSAPTKNPVTSPTTASPTKNPVTSPVTPAPVTPRPVASKSNKSSKTPKPVTPKPTPAPITPRPTTSKASKSTKRL